MEGASTDHLRRQLQELQTDVGSMWKRRDHFSGESSAPRALLAPPPPPPPAPPALLRRGQPAMSYPIDVGAHGSPSLHTTAQRGGEEVQLAASSALDASVGSHNERTLLAEHGGLEKNPLNDDHGDDGAWRSSYPTSHPARRVSPKAGYLVVERLPQDDQAMTRWLCGLSDGTMSVSGLMGAMNQDIRRHSISLNAGPAAPSLAATVSRAGGPITHPSAPQPQAALSYHRPIAPTPMSTTPALSPSLSPAQSLSPRSSPHLHFGAAPTTAAAAVSHSAPPAPGYPTTTTGATTATTTTVAMLEQTATAAVSSTAPPALGSTTGWSDEGRSDRQRQFRAMAQSLAGLGARMYNWSLTAGLKEAEYIGFWNLILQYLDPCKQLDERIADTCKGIRKSLGESNESKLQPSKPSPSPSLSPSPSPSESLGQNDLRSHPSPRGPSAIERSFADTCYASARAIAQGAPLVAPENRVVLQPMQKHFAGTAPEEVVVTFTASQEALRLNGTYKRRPKVVVNGRPVYERGRKCVVHLDDGTWCIKDGPDGDSGAFVYAFVLDAADEPFAVREPWQVMDDGDGFVMDKAGSIHPYGSPKNQRSAGNQDGGSGAS